MVEGRCVRERGLNKRGGKWTPGQRHLGNEEAYRGRSMTLPRMLPLGFRYGPPGYKKLSIRHWWTGNISIQLDRIDQNAYIDSSALNDCKSVLRTNQHSKTHAPDVEHEKNCQRPDLAATQGGSECMSSSVFFDRPVVGMPRKCVQISECRPRKREHWNIHPNVCRVEKMVLFP